MKKRILQIAAVCLTAAMLLTGCGVIDLAGYFRRLSGMIGGTVAFEDMEYTRPDMTAMETTLGECLTAAETETDVDTLMEWVWEFYAHYSSFYTNYYLAYIHYNIDLSDIYWTQEYEFCAENSAAADGGLDQLYYALADSPLREELESDDYFGAGYFDAYDGDSVWTEEFTSLMEQEAALQNEYYQLTAQAAGVEYYSDAYFTEYGTQLAALYVELIALRQQIAAEAGYASYPDFAYDFYYYRDYTADQAADYTARIRAELVPLYRRLNESDFWDRDTGTATEQMTFDYVKQAAEAMGGDIADAFGELEDGGLYHISYGENKYTGSFELFLLDYYAPFVFVSPTGTVRDQLTFAHEFGHFCNDYVSYGSMAGVDVAEIFSQGMEYLSLCYGQGTDELTALKMADGLCVYVEQAAYASFEDQVYDLTGDDLTVENVQAIYEQVGTDFGFDTWELWDSRDYVAINHFYTNPMYIISYVVSNDAALQLYQMEQEKAGTGLNCYTSQLATEQAFFLAFLEDAGLENPFTDGRLEAVAQTLEHTLF